MNDPEPADGHEPGEPTPPADVPVIAVADWFQEGREVILDLNGDRYRLRLTRRQKLLLQK